MADELPDLLTYSDGQWISRETVNIESTGEFEQSVGCYIYRDGSWQSIFAPEFQHKSANDDHNHVLGYGSGVY